MPTANLDLCPELPGVGDDLKITLPFGGAMKAMRDISQGIPNDCTMSFNLLLQLQPLLGGLDCLLKILDALSKIKTFLESVPNPIKMGESALEAVEALGKLATCFPPAIYINICSMIKDILTLIINIMSCVIEFLDSVTSFNAKIDFDTAEGNPALLEILDCAKSNSDLTLEHLLASLKPLQAIFDAIQPVIGFVPALADLSIELPSLEDLSPDADLSETTDKLKEVVGTLQEIVDAIPC